MPTDQPVLSIPDQASMGPLLFTAGISALAEDSSTLANLSLKIDLYTSGDWGSIDEDDWQANLDTINSPHSGGTIMGAYKLYNDTRVWIITTGYGNQHMGKDHCYTTVLLPEEY